ncbi:MAG: hypothetical protein M1834_009200 [Cirrosporium novae-zelandiae]|nr:MAG: hypothetical protein M1834_009200 [Cirrosporium novae-zelandiae]
MASNSSIQSCADPKCGDVEANNGEAYLQNDIVRTFSWRNITVTVKDHKIKKPKTILSGTNGFVKAGELVALMGPSGSGKTTLLNVLARRSHVTSSDPHGEVMVNGTTPSLKDFRLISSFVEQEDALIGSLTVRETLNFAARLALPSNIGKVERIRRVDSLVKAFGLNNQASTLIGTPVRKGISGGQKRRVSVASQLITGPRILFLDEPTSGLDSQASFEVMSFVRSIAKTNNLIVIASIHQPSTSTFELFDKLLLLSQGSTCYFGPLREVPSYFDLLGYQLPLHTNPAEYLLDLTNTDFAIENEGAFERLKSIQSSWESSSELRSLRAQIEEIEKTEEPTEYHSEKLSRTHRLLIPLTLLHRSFIKSYRDVVAYGIRIAMYLGLAIMMGTLRLNTTQEDIQPFINAIFFGSAFMSFMAVAYVPAFLEDRASFVKERANGLYGATAFMVSNFLIGIPYLFLIAVLFSIIAYWLSNFTPSGVAFMYWVMWLFLDLIAAESLVVLVASVFPNFVIALALTAFANGLWMSVGGFLVSPKVLNVFWRYVFHYIDYQTYVFQGMMVNEFSRRTYSCSTGCHCMYQTDLAPQCKISGKGVLETYGYAEGKTREWVGILMGIVAGYRLLGWLVTYIRRT